MGSKAKLISLRVALDDMKSFSKGWLFKFSNDKVGGSFSGEELTVLSDFILHINWVESLGQVNYTRIGNISLGAELVHGTVLKPGQMFSLRRALGNATVKRGFGAGPVIKHGVTTTTVGGGLCLVSSILFNVALLANLRIHEKFNHGTDLWGEDRFVGLGLDATYAYGILDLKFENSLDHDIVIEMGVNEEERFLWCRILGHKADKAEVRIESEVLKELVPDEHEMGKDFQKGWEVRTLRYAGDDGEEITYDQREVYRWFYR